MNDKIEISVEKFLAKEINSVEIKNNDLFSRIISKLNFENVDNESQLYFLAKNAVLNAGNPKHSRISSMEAKALIFAAPLEALSFIYEFILKAQKKAREQNIDLAKVFNVDNFYELRITISEIKQHFETKSEEDKNYRALLNNIDLEMSKYMRFKIMPTLIEISKNHNISNTEIDNHVGFLLEPLYAFALPEPTGNRDIEKDQVYWVKMYILPIAVELLEFKTGFSLVTFLERYIYSTTTKKNESLENHGKLLRMCSYFYHRAGRTSGAHLLKALSEQGYKSELLKPRNYFKNIAFVLLGDPKTGHIQQILALVRSYKSIQPSDGKKFYLLCHANGDMEPIREAAQDTPFTVLEAGKDFLHAGGGLALASCYLIAALKYNIRDFIAVSVSQQIFFLSGFLQSVHLKTNIRLQIYYFGMKNYLGFTDPDIINIKGASIPDNLIDGKWKNIKSNWHPELFDQEKATQGIEIKERLLRENDASVIVGAIARSERFNDEYIKIISTILNKFKNIIFIYGSNNKVDRFEALIESEKIKKRIKYLEFVDPKIYCQVIDIIADTFPFGSSLVGLYCMANNSSIITMDTFNAKLSSWHAFYGAQRIDKLRMKSCINPFPKSKKEYQELLSKLCENPDTLKKYKKVLNEFYLSHEDEMNTPKRVMDELLSIIEEN